MYDRWGPGCRPPFRFAPALAMTSEKSPTDRHGTVAVRPYADIVAQDQAAVDAAIDAIFFEASSVQSFADEPTRRAFRWRWLGRYLAEEPENAFVAVRDDGGIVGYLVGSLADPAARAEFSELVYFKDFADHTAVYPAHLHINVAPAWRSAGIGAALVAAFATHAGRCGAGGMHVVTGAGMRNVRFYERLGFAVVGEAAYKGGTVVMLGAKLAA